MRKISFLPLLLAAFASNAEIVEEKGTFRDTESGLMFKSREGAAAFLKKARKINEANKKANENIPQTIGIEEALDPDTASLELVQINLPSKEKPLITSGKNVLAYALENNLIASSPEFHGHFFLDQGRLDKIMKALSLNTSIENLKISENAIMHSFFIKLLNALKTNHSLKILYLPQHKGGSGFSGEIYMKIAKAFADMIRENTALEEILNLNEDIMGGCLEEVLPALQDNLTLKRISIPIRMPDPEVRQTVAYIEEMNAGRRKQGLPELEVILTRSQKDLLNIT